MVVQTRSVLKSVAASEWVDFLQKINGFFCGIYVRIGAKIKTAIFKQRIDDFDLWVAFVGNLDIWVPTITLF